MKIPIYDLIHKTMLMHKDQYLKKSEIAQLTGLQPEQVSRVIRAAYKLGWVERIARTLNENAFGEGKFSAMRTAYKITRTESWMGLMPLYHQVLENEKNR